CIAVILGSWWLLALLGTGMVVAAYEYFNLTRLGGHHPLWQPALVLIAALLINASARPVLPYDFTSLILVITVALPPLWELTRRAHEGFLLNWSLMVLGVVYIGLLGSYTFALRNLQDGAALLFIPLLAVWLTDTFAYVAGRAFGKTPFFPDISPKKTREGAIGGIIGGTLTVGILGTIFGMPIGAAFLGGVIIAILTTAGDLTESLIKRNLGVKDSGTLIAGHGGVFDRLDSMFFPLTFAYFYFTLVLGYK
ncbi:MAG TPA: phosphatidate cytidylyltransferase, partial [Anaerolineae bacterium]|nr:phosphatidate cytidylyltransferase [Anaerolineae bacterium]